MRFAKPADPRRECACSGLTRKIPSPPPPCSKKKAKKKRSSSTTAAPLAVLQSSRYEPCSTAGRNSVGVGGGRFFRARTGQSESSRGAKTEACGPEAIPRLCRDVHGKDKKQGDLRLPV